WNSIQFNIFNNFFEFGKRYCNPTKKYIPGKGLITTYDGYSNLEELYAILRMTIFIRRTKDQVLKDIPAKHRYCIYLDDILPAKKNNIDKDMQSEEKNVEKDTKEEEKNVDKEDKNMQNVE